MKENEIRFASAKGMVCWLIDNEGDELADGYGRKWKYESNKFYFKDIGLHDEYQEGVRCLHLYGTYIKII